MKKRIALAAVAALAGGLLVAAPASATAASNAGTPFFVGNIATTSSPTSATAAATETATVLASTASVVNYVTINTVGTDTVTAGGYLTVTGSTFASTTDGTLSADATKITYATAGIDTSSASVVIPAALGTVVVKYTTAVDNGSSITYAVAQTITISIVAAPAAEAYNHSVVSDFGSLASGAYVAANGGLFAKKGAVNTATSAASFTVKQYSSADTATLTSASLTKAVTVSLSGVGTLNGTGNVSYQAYSAGAGNTQTVVVYSDGRSGTATITIAVDGAVLATKNVTFYGDVAAFTASLDKAQIQDTDTAVLTVTAKDSNGIAVPISQISGFAISDETATVGSANNANLVPGTETYTVTGVSSSAFKAVLTVGNYLVDTKTVVANFVLKGVKTIAVAADKAAYAPGEKATFTVTAKNSDGVVAGDGTYSLVLSGSTAFYGAPASVKVVNGTGSFTAYMPVAQGPVILVASVEASDAATLNLSVVDPAAAAQAAAITALQTSVATLTTTVASLVASMTAQIKVINATMLKIQKALAALSKKVK